MANVNKEPNLVRAYLDKREEMRKPVWHIFPNPEPNMPARRICTGKDCRWCKEAQGWKRRP